jgi:cytochrome c556
MLSERKTILGIYLILAVVAWSSLIAQDKKDPSHSETSTEVPELSKFHEVIYKIWHTAWPNKDVAMLKDLLPEVEELGGDLVKTQLPGILREKKTAWEKNIEKMKSVMADYRTAVKEDNGQKLLDAAERLHAQYETMVRVIRPALKELDDFHSALYPLYHYYMPQKDKEKIKASVSVLTQRMQALYKATLPSKFKGKESAFKAAKKELAAALKTLEVSVSGSDQNRIGKDINAVHSRYEELNKVFE